MKIGKLAILVTLAAAMLATPATGGTAVTEVPVLTSEAGEFQPARGLGFLAWEQNTRKHPKHYDVFAKADGGGEVRVNPRKTQAAMGGVDGSTLVYQEFRGEKSTLRFYGMDTKQRSNPPAGVNTKAWEYWPSLSGRWLLFAREFDNGRRLLILYDLQAETRRILDRTKGEKEFIGPGQVNGDYAVWSTCTPRCDVLVHHIPTDTTTKVPNPGAYQRGPSVTPGGVVYFSQGKKRCGSSVTLVRYPPGGPAESLLDLQDPLDIHDTFVFSGPTGETEVFYERVGCGRAAASDIFKIVDAQAGTITIRKDAQPDDPQNFEFEPSDTLQLDNFILDDDADPAFSNQRAFTGLPAGTYTVREVLSSLPGTWNLTGLDCTGGGSNTSVSPSTGTATIGLDGGENVVCTFTNTREGVIAVVLDAEPPTGNDFSFSPSGNLPGGGFVLDDDGETAVLSNQKSFSGLFPGTYTVQQTAAGGGYTLSSITCVGGGPNTSDGGSTATIGLDPGESVVCTYVNDGP